MSNLAVVDISIGRTRREESGEYRLELRYTDPDPENQGTLDPEARTVGINSGRLQTERLTPEDYGALLSEMLYGGAGGVPLRTWFEKVSARGDVTRIRVAWKSRCYRLWEFDDRK